MSPIRPPMPGCQPAQQLEWRRPSISPTAGGCTFAEDPGGSCALVLRLWSAAADQRVLTARAVRPSGRDCRLFDGRSSDVRIVRGSDCEYLLVDRGGAGVRIDVIEGSVAAGRVILRFDLTDDDRLETRVAAIHTFRNGDTKRRRYPQLAGRLLALQAVDVHDAGASLREIAEHLLGPGTWPGDGEHRKSLVRRLVVTGAAMIRAGPHVVLGGG